MEVQIHLVLKLEFCPKLERNRYEINEVDGALFWSHVTLPLSEHYSEEK